MRHYDLRMGQLHVDYIGSECYKYLAGLGRSLGKSLICFCVCVCVAGPITCVCFSQDGQCTLSSSLDASVRLLDKNTGELLGE